MAKAWRNHDIPALSTNLCPSPMCSGKRNHPYPQTHNIPPAGCPKQAPQAGYCGISCNVNSLGRSRQRFRVPRRRQGRMDRQYYPDGYSCTRWKSSHKTAPNSQSRTASSLRHGYFPAYENRSAGNPVYSSIFRFHSVPPY